MVPSEILTELVLGQLPDLIALVEDEGRAVAVGRVGRRDLLDVVAERGVDDLAREVGAHVLDELAGELRIEVVVHRPGDGDLQVLGGRGRELLEVVRLDARVDLLDGVDERDDPARARVQHVGLDLAQEAHNTDEARGHDHHAQRQDPQHEERERPGNERAAERIADPDLFLVAGIVAEAPALELQLVSALVGHGGDQDCADRADDQQDQKDCRQEIHLYLLQSDAGRDVTRDVSCTKNAQRQNVDIRH